MWRWRALVGGEGETREGGKGGEEGGGRGGRRSLPSSFKEGEVRLIQLREKGISQRRQGMEKRTLLKSSPVESLQI